MPLKRLIHNLDLEEPLPHSGMKPGTAREIQVLSLPKKSLWGSSAPLSTELTGNPASGGNKNWAPEVFVHLELTFACPLSLVPWFLVKFQIKHLSHSGDSFS